MAVPLREYWKVLVTMLAQFVGAFVAALVAQGVSGQLQYPASNIVHGTFGAAVFECIWTALLVYVVCAVMTPTHGDEEQSGEERRGHSRSYQGLAIGFAIAGGIYCATATGGGSGGVFNPALGSAIVSIDAAFNGKSAAHLWVYWVGPLAGSFLGAGLFTLLHYHKDPMLLEYDITESSVYLPPGTMGMNGMGQ
ncbi:MAG: hypothetical protein EOO41_01125 [Methanobacteriota archaeon]|nr:MAG: hypothetical protein EOO41_01125 [Euryarchaeota archaeon]